MSEKLSHDFKLAEIMCNQMPNLQADSSSDWLHRSLQLDTVGDGGCYKFELPATNYTFPAATCYKTTQLSESYLRLGDFQKKKTIVQTRSQDLPAPW